VKRLAAILSTVLCSSQILAFASNFSAPVVSVLDGDTLEVLHNQHLIVSD
jgi:endonuclease YncB( thermonuclease family)